MDEKNHHVLILPNEIKEHLKQIPYLDLDAYLINGRIPVDVLDNLRNEIPAEIIQEVELNILRKLTDPKFGYIVLDNYVPKNSSVQEKLFYSSIICSFIGKQFKVIKSALLWNSLGVNLNKEVYESEGLGYNCVHVDVPNTTKIPEITCLFCNNPDYYNGGQTIVSNIPKIIEFLTKEEIELCKEKIFWEGKHFNLMNVGDKYLPFPIIEFKDDDFIFRFSGKMKFDERNKSFYPLLSKIEEILLNQSKVFLLERDNLLFVNQYYSVHGRTPLGGDQTKLTMEQKRLIFQSKLELN